MAASVDFKRIFQQATLGQLPTDEQALLLADCEAIDDCQALLTAAAKIRDAGFQNVISYFRLRTFADMFVITARLRRRQNLLIRLLCRWTKCCSRPSKRLPKAVKRLYLLWVKTRAALFDGKASA